MKTALFVVATLAAALAAAPVLAQTQNNGLGGVGAQANGYGGQGGQGGQGGNGYGFSASKAGVYDSGNSYNRNYNNNDARATSGAAVFSKGNDMATNVDASTRVDAAPAPSPHIALTSNGCIGSVSGSGTAPVVGIGVGVTRDHDDCFKLEMAKFYQARGDGQMADIMLQSTAWYKEAMEDHEEASAKKAAADKARQTAFFERNGYPVTTIRLQDGTAEQVSWNTPRVDVVARAGTTN